MLHGITAVDGRHIGLVRGIGLVEEGDVVRLVRNGVAYKWQVIEVSPKGLTYKKLAATPDADH